MIHDLGLKIKPYSLKRHEKFQFTTSLDIFLVASI
jgi:hypothetical protein